MRIQTSKRLTVDRFLDPDLCFPFHLSPYDPIIHVSFFWKRINSKLSSIFPNLSQYCQQTRPPPLPPQSPVHTHAFAAETFH